MNEQKLKEIEARCEAATEPPAIADLECFVVLSGEEKRDPDLVFIEHARFDMLALIAALREAWARLDVITDIGVYPKAVIGGVGAYDKRTEFMEGWNACTVEVCRIAALDADKLQALRDAQV